MYHLSKTLVLVGLMGAGKTAIGTLVAQRLGVDFVDSDEEIVRAANMSIAEIFDRDGVDFRSFLGKSCADLRTRRG